MRKIARLCRKLERQVGGRWIVNKRATPLYGTIYELHFQTGDGGHFCVGEDNVRNFRCLADLERYLLDQFL